MSSTYMPDADKSFSEWVDNFATYASGHVAEIGLVAADLVPTTTCQAEWVGSYGAHVTAHILATAATARKNSDRSALEDAIRQVVAKLRANPNLTDEQKKLLGIKSSAPQPEPAPAATIPNVNVDFSTRLKHTLKYWDASGDEEDKHIPADTKGCEVWVKIGDYSENPSEYALADLGLDPTCSVTHLPENHGKTAHYMLRWRFKDGNRGDWSKIISATIAA